MISKESPKILMLHRFIKFANLLLISNSRMLLQEVQELAPFCAEYDPALRCATPWDPEFTCPEGQHPCRSNCGNSRCLANYHFTLIVPGFIDMYLYNCCLCVWMVLCFHLLII
ncbi:hypothetical protein MKW98_007193 [Papaver atlanticum]|uniref:Uncharacterized protein n=1 Tax=Papaver atlanticum TaxID=357466 RepID=A0AAD4XFU3_9MAGN|nr:hypothetical protein MKW98_007193 [Papaver atlanticum]